MGKTRAGRFALRGQRTTLLHLETMTQAVDSADSVDPRALEALNRYFGYDSFRPGQSGIVSAILTGHDVLGVMPTGAGKSICYQIPAAILPGVAIVISPLISLMRDQVDALNDVGLPAAFINTTQTPDEQDLVFAQALSGQIKLLYVAPERLETERFRNFAVRVPISLVAVDEAHCVSQWGQDFRSSYLGIGEFIAGLPTHPTVAAFTATATERVRRDIVSILGLHTPSITVTGFDRPNLYFDVISMPRKDKASWVASYIASHPDESGIVYCATRKETEALAESLNSAVAELRAAGGADVSDIGTIAVAYHGGMSADAREKAQRDFVTDRVPVVVATNAFGMGIDKSNVRFVIHHNMPESNEAYYQEAGRAGRDGEPSRCTLLWNESDIVTRRRLLDSDYENERLTPEEQEAVRASKRRLLDAMVGYCRTTDCLHAYLSRYFGETARQMRGRLRQLRAHIRNHRRHRHRPSHQPLRARCEPACRQRQNRQGAARLEGTGSKLSQPRKPAVVRHARRSAGSAHPRRAEPDGHRRLPDDRGRTPADRRLRTPCGGNGRTRIPLRHQEDQTC